MKKSELKEIIKECISELINEEMSSGEFDKLLKGYMKELDDYHKAYYAKNYKNLKPPVFSYTEGQRFVKIIKADSEGVQKSVHCFVDYDGNIYKAAGWKVPAKGARGNLKDKKKPLDSKDFYRR
jgi:hypothetical protein